MLPTSSEYKFKSYAVNVFNDGFDVIWVLASHPTLSLMDEDMLPSGIYGRLLL
jgi:hypothetical protein